MRVGQFTAEADEAPWTGVVTPNEDVVNVHVAGSAAGFDLPTGTRGLLEAWEWQRKVELTVEYAEETGTGLLDAADVTPSAPLTDPQKIVCVGLNYRDHAEEGDNPIPDEPILFSKYPTALNGPGDEIRWDPELTQKVDFEAELVIVIGRKARRVDEAEAAACIAGYTVGNDVSARDLQHGDGQWVRGKTLDTFAPIGPSIVTADDIDPTDLRIWTDVNGDRQQDSSTAEFIFGPDELVSFCSQAFTLLPGDVIFTGTPPGVGVYQDPPNLLEDGDTVTVGIEGIGELTNTCRTE